jgi:hypothetical protein
MLAEGTRDREVAQLAEARAASPRSRSMHRERVCGRGGAPELRCVGACLARRSAARGSANTPTLRIVALVARFAQRTPLVQHGLRIERTRENVFTIVASGQELSALVAGARMALDVMRTAPQPVPADAVETLERVLRGLARARERLAREQRPGG